MNDYISNMTIY